MCETAITDQTSLIPMQLNYIRPVYVGLAKPQGQLFKMFVNHSFARHYEKRAMLSFRLESVHIGVHISFRVALLMNIFLNWIILVIGIDCT